MSKQILPAQRCSLTGRVPLLLARMDQHEDTERNIVTVLIELPGVKKEDVDVQVENGRLTVTAENKLPVEFEEAGYAVREIRYGHFLRSINLPRGVEVSSYG